MLATPYSWITSAVAGYIAGAITLAAEVVAVEVVARFAESVALVVEGKQHQKPSSSANLVMTGSHCIPTGMCCAAFTIVWMKIQLEWHSIIFCSFGAVFGLILGKKERLCYSHVTQK